MANEPAAIEATPLVTMLVVAVRVVLGCWVTRLVMVVWGLPVAVVDRLLRTVDERMVDEGGAAEVLAELAVREAELEPVALLEGAVSDADAEVLVLPPTILKGKPHWKMVLSESSVIWMP
jgi:hypothetical protein